MNDSLKTTIFAATALVMLGLSGWAYVATRPPEASDFDKIGQPFFERFTDAGAARSLEVSAIDPETLELRQFRVEYRDGLWRIPSHYNYPAEAADRLAATAASVLGLERESMVGRTKSDHERFGVLDPLDPELSDPEAAGQRITIRDEVGDVLVDLIIGKPAGEAEANPEQLAFDEVVATKYFYVRRPDENQTYKIRLDIDLSTRFADWIRPDLLEISQEEMREIDIRNYRLEERPTSPAGARELFKIQGDQLVLRRDGAFGPWSLDELNEVTEELDNARVDRIVRTLDELRIVGVRPKTTYQGKPIITADLKINRIPELEENPERFREMIQDVQYELEDYGFNLAPGPGGPRDLQLVSEKGEVSVGTDAGVRYTLHFGKTVEGDEREIEVGGTMDRSAENGSESGQSEKGKSSGDADQASDVDAPTGQDDAGSGNKKTEAKNRYVMIRVEVDESLLGERPVEPVPPEPPVKPEGYVPRSENAESDNDAAPAPADSQAAEEASDPQEAESGGSEQSPDNRDPAFIEYDRMMQAFEQAKTDFELEKTRYEDQLKAWNERLERAKKRVAELNERFAEWFYVISAENLADLQATRADLVKPKESEGEGPDMDLPKAPNIDFDPVGITPGGSSADKAESGERPDGVPDSVPRAPSSDDPAAGGDSKAVDDPDAGGDPDAQATGAPDPSSKGDSGSAAQNDSDSAAEGKSDSTEQDRKDSDDPADAGDDDQAAVAARGRSSG